MYNIKCMYSLCIYYIIHLNVCVCVCECVCIYMYVCMYVCCMYACVCVCVRMCVCIYICKHSQRIRFGNMLFTTEIHHVHKLIAKFRLLEFQNGLIINNVYQL